MASLIVLALAALIGQIWSTAVLWLSARLVKSRRAQWRWALLAVAAMDALAIALLCAEAALPAPVGNDGLIGRQVLLIVVSVVVVTLIVKAVFALRWRGAWGQVGILLMSQIPLYLLALLVVRPYLAEAFNVPTNSMAPTFLGWHDEIVCPKCGGIAILPIYLDPLGRPSATASARSHDAICSVCRTVSVVDRPPAPRAERNACDRFMVRKWGQPGRWDIVAIRTPHGVFAKRLVGLPGETVYVAEGTVWINGKQLDVPTGLKGQTYVTAGPSGSPIRYGAREHPVELHSDECFLLGDFSLISEDSRYTGPTKMSDIIGIADLRYWPLARVAFLR